MDEEVIISAEQSKKKTLRFGGIEAAASAAVLTGIVGTAFVVAGRSRAAAFVFLAVLVVTTLGRREASRKTTALAFLALLPSVAVVLVVLGTRR